MFMCRMHGGDSMMNKLLTKASLYRTWGGFVLFSIKKLNVDSVKRLGLGVAYGKHKNTLTIHIDTHPPHI